MEKKTVVIIGAGPGGYTAAFHAAKKAKVILVDEENPGGVCLYRGCIPSKALLHASHVFDDYQSHKRFGVEFSKPKLNLKKLKSWKQETIDQLKNGLLGLIKQKKIELITARATFSDNKTLRLDFLDSGEQKTLKFDQAIIATGSRSIRPQSFDWQHPALWSSTQALELKQIPKKLLVIGGGYIGLELGSVYANLGSQVDLVEAESRLLPQMHSQLVSILQKKLAPQFHQLLFNTKLTKLEPQKEKLKAFFKSEKEESSAVYDAVLLAIGRVPNSSGLNLKAAGVDVEKGFVKVNDYLQTTNHNIFAIGDVIGNPMLAHKASYEAVVAASNIFETKNLMPNQPKAIPEVIFCEPELAWCGLNEEQAKEKGYEPKLLKTYWKASGRFLTISDPQDNGLTLLVIDKKTQLVLGGGMVGPHAGEMIAEIAHAIEMGAYAYDLAQTIHPHPTLVETIKDTAEKFL